MLLSYVLYLRLLALSLPVAQPLRSWDILANTYPNPSWTHIHQLRSQLRSITKDSQTIVEYIQNIKILVDELALIGHPLSAEDITDKVLDGLDPNPPY